MKKDDSKETLDALKREAFIEYKRLEKWPDWDAIAEKFDALIEGKSRRQTEAILSGMAAALFDHHVGGDCIEIENWSVDAVGAAPFMYWYIRGMCDADKGPD